jgi:LPXTG-site transpeptidase (sortase) family protein
MNLAFDKALGGRIKVHKKVLRKVFLLFFVLEFIYVFLNFGALVEKISFDIFPKKAIEDYPENLDKSYAKEILYDGIQIPKIGVSAPIIFNSGITEKEIMENLKRGVVYYSNSNLPDEEGISVYFGHSSNFWWVNSKYNTTFVLLPELEMGDEVFVNYAKRKYKYKVVEKKIIGANEWEELNNPDLPSGVALVTCWPMGTALKRYVIFAEREFD